GVKLVGRDENLASPHHNYQCRNCDLACLRHLSSCNANTCETERCGLVRLPHCARCRRARASARDRGDCPPRRRQASCDHHLGSGDCCLHFTVSRVCDWYSDLWLLSALTSPAKAMSAFGP